MIAFNGIIENGLVVNHIDSDKTNNRLDNHEITTYSDNSKSVIPVHQLSLDDNIIAEFSSIQNAANATNINPKNINNCVNGHQGPSGGFRWEHI